MKKYNFILFLWATSLISIDDIFQSTTGNFIIKSIANNIVLTAGNKFSITSQINENNQEIIYNQNISSSNTTLGSSVSKNLYVQGNLTIDASITITGNVTVTGNLTINTSTTSTIIGNLTVYGSVSLASGATLTVNNSITCDGRDTTSTSTKQIAISGTLNTKNLYIRNYNTTAGIACSFASTATLTIIGDTIVENVKSSSNHAVSCSATINANGHILFKNNSSTAASSSGVVVSGSNTLSTKNGNLIFKSNSSTQSHGVQILNTVTISGFNTMFIDNIGSGASNSGVFLQSTTLTIARNDLHFHNNVGGDTATDSGVDSDGTLRTKFIHSSAEATNQNISYGGNEYDQYGATDTTALATARRYTRRRNSATVTF